MLDQQKQWKDMYDHALKRTEGDTSPNAITVVLNHLYSDEVRQGVWDLSAPWSEEVIRPYAKEWKHVFDGHGPGTRVTGKSHFPDDWPEAKVKWAVYETICAPDIVDAATDGNREYRYKIIEDMVIRVWLQKRRNTKGRFMVNTAYPMMADGKDLIWNRIKDARTPTQG